jgi:hypothetical protein
MLPANSSLGRSTCTSTSVWLLRPLLLLLLLLVWPPLLLLLRLPLLLLLLLWPPLLLLCNIAIWEGWAPEYALVQQPCRCRPSLELSQHICNRNNTAQRSTAQQSTMQPRFMTAAQTGGYQEMAERHQNQRE